MGGPFARYTLGQLARLLGEVNRTCKGNTGSFAVETTMRREREKNPDTDFTLRSVVRQLHRQNGTP